MGDGDRDGETLDSVLRGQVRLYQRAAGYRVSVDSLLLVDFVGAAPYGRVLDLGTGSGVIALALATRDPAARVEAVELQPQLARLAERNVELNGLQGRVRIREGDLTRAREIGILPDAFDLVVSNPPYQKVGTGEHSAEGERAVARHEVALTLEGLVRALRMHTRAGGRVALVYPAERAAELMAGLEAEKLRVVRLRAVHGRAGEPARRVLVEAVKGGKAPLMIWPPLVLTDDQGGRTPEHLHIVGEGPEGGGGGGGG